MAAFHSSVPDRLLKGRGGIQIWACQEEMGEKGGISQAPASRPLLGTHPLSRAGAGLDPTSLGRRHSNSLYVLSPREVKGLTQEGRKAEHIPKGHSQVYLKPKPGRLHKAVSTPPAPPHPPAALRVPFPLLTGRKAPHSPGLPWAAYSHLRRIILNLGNAN